MAGILETSYVFGPYVLTHKLWSDQVACYYRGVAVGGGELLIRVLHAHLAVDDRHVSAFVEEGLAGQALGPTAEVLVIDVGIIDGQAFWGVDFPAGQRMRPTPAPPAFAPIEPWLPGLQRHPTAPSGAEANR